MDFHLFVFFSKRKKWKTNCFSMFCILICNWISLERMIHGFVTFFVILYTLALPCANFFKDIGHEWTVKYFHTAKVRGHHVTAHCLIASLRHMLLFALAFNSIHWKFTFNSIHWKLRLLFQKGKGDVNQTLIQCVQLQLQLGVQLHSEGLNRRYVWLRGGCGSVVEPLPPSCSHCWSVVYECDMNG